MNLGRRRGRPSPGRLEARELTILSLSLLLAELVESSEESFIPFPLGISSPTKLARRLMRV